MVNRDPVDTVLFSEATGRMFRNPEGWDAVVFVFHSFFLVYKKCESRGHITNNKSRLNQVCAINFILDTNKQLKHGVGRENEKRSNNESQSQRIELAVNEIKSSQ